MPTLTLFEKKMEANISACLTANHIYFKNHPQKWSELNRIPRDQLVVMQPMPNGLIPCQSKLRHPHLTQSHTISTQRGQETMM